MDTLKADWMTFRYPGAEQPALEEVSFGVERGEKATAVNEMYNSATHSTNPHGQCASPPLGGSMPVLHNSAP